MEIFLKNRLSFTDKITFLPCRAAFPFVNTCVPANTRVLGKCLTSLLALQAPPTPPHPTPLRGAGGGLRTPQTPRVTQLLGSAWSGGLSGKARRGVSLDHHLNPNVLAQL